MAWSYIRNYGLLDRWKTRMLQQEYQFQQVDDKYSSYSPSVWIQQERDELANALLSEVETFRYWLGYSPLPMYFTDTFYYDQDVILSTDKRLQTYSSTKVINFGKEAFEVLGNGTVAYSGNKATVSFTSSEPVTDELILIFKPVDSDSTELDLRYQIFANKPKYDTDTGVYTFTAHQALFVKPTLQAYLDSFVGGNPKQRKILQVADTSNYVEEVTVVRRYTDTTIQAELLYFDNNDVLTTSVVPVRLVSGSTGEFNLSKITYPNLKAFYGLKIYYQAGMPLTETNALNPALETMLVRRAKSSLPIEVELVTYRVSNAWGDDNKYVETSPMYQNPLGNKLVDYHTWKTFQVYSDPVSGATKKYV